VKFLTYLILFLTACRPELATPVTTKEEKNAIIDKTVKLEGGYVNNPNDSGGPTKYGITLRTLQNYRNDPNLGANDVKKLTKEEAKDIYGKLYFDDAGVGSLPKSIQDFMFDMNVHHGMGRSTKILQESLNELGADIAVDGGLGPATKGALDDYLGDSEDGDERDRKEKALRRQLLRRRKEFVRKLAKRRPKDKEFLTGWLNRINKFEV